MQKGLVEDRHWFSRADYLQGLAFCQLSPGPLAGTSHPQAVAGVPSLFNIRVLLNGSDDRLAPHSLPSKFDVPPNKFPAVRPGLAMAKPKISSLVACSDFPLLR